MKIKLLAICGLMMVTSTVAADMSKSYCDSDKALGVAVTINQDNTLRKNVPSTLFGFALTWYDFQLGFYRNGAVRPEVIAWLRPFSGAIYRFWASSVNDWPNTVGDTAARSAVSASYTDTGFAFPYFGPEEYFQFLTQVDGKGIMLLDMISHGGATTAESSIIKNSSNFVSWVKNQSSLGCVSGSACRIKYWELGNEPDWGKTPWSGAQYAQKINGLITSLNESYPGIALLTAGKTAPWQSAVATDAFNYAVASQLGKQVSGVTMHPYYDGISIPVMTSLLARTVKPYRLFNQNAKMVITEHGRWPHQSHQNWQDDWYLASGSGGAVSAADFIISSAKLAYVDAAAWHMLATRGPWQLFHRIEATDQLYPSAVYWGLRTLRNGFLSDRIQVTPETTQDDSYSGNYGLNLLAMKSADGRISLMGVNRSPKPVLLSINLSDSSAALTTKNVSYDYFVADADGTDNTDLKQNRFTMQSETISSNNLLPSHICVAGNSVFSLH